MRTGVKGLTAGLLFALFAIPTHSAAKESTIASTPAVAAKELASTLRKMGYRSVEIHQSKLKFERDLGNQCPSDRALSYFREIDLRNLDMASISRIKTQSSDQGAFFYFSIEPTEDYRRRAYPILAFVEKTMRDYPGLNWPFQIDENLPDIRREFLKKFPDTMNLNRWVKKTCFGESPSLYIIFRMSFDDRAALSEFRVALIQYADSLTTSD